jgi:hypothetical protein
LAWTDIPRRLLRRVLVVVADKGTDTSQNENEPHPEPPPLPDRLKKATIVGTARADVLKGTARADVIVGLGAVTRSRA